MCDHSVRASEFLRHTIISGGLRFLQFHYLREFQNFCGTQSQFLCHVVTKGAAEFLWHVVTTRAAEFLQQPVTNRAAEFLHHPFMLAVKMHTFYEQTTSFNPNYTNITTFLSDILHIAEINTHLN